MVYYTLLYFFPNIISPFTQLFDPLSFFLKNQPASHWFAYGSLYTLIILIFGIKFLWKYKNNPYQILRTLSVMFFQLGFAFLLPEILQKFQYPYYDPKNMWPLNYSFFDSWNIENFLSKGNLGIAMLLFGIAMILIISPILTYFFGKRWYCSWVCGCGGLAETAGDDFRHLSDKSMRSWKIEKWMIHIILAFILLSTIAIIYDYIPNRLMFSGTVLLAITTFLLWIFLDKKRFTRLDPVAKKIALILGILIALSLSLAYFFNWSSLFLLPVYYLQLAYGFVIGAIFSGILGVGLYPFMGNRVWCRFGCPLAAILGFQQKFLSKFRISTNKNLCISCGNCSKYCEMGIDVRSYAELGMEIKRSSCVGCGICEAVCPRGVIKLENNHASISNF
jgi:polyferredoxin